MRPILAAASTLCLLSACATTPPVETTRAVGPSFVIDTSGWTGDSGLSFTVAFDTVDIGGRPHVCGAYGYSTSFLQGPTSRMIHGGAVVVNGEPVLRNLGFFARYGGVRSDAGIVGRAANCAMLPRALRASDEVSLAFGNGDFYN